MMRLIALKSGPSTLQALYGADCIAASRPDRNGAVASSRVERFPVGEKINWQIGEMVGAGAFGRVYLGLNNDTGQLMAVKQVRMMLNASIATANITVLLAGQQLLLVAKIMLISAAKVLLLSQGNSRCFGCSPCAQ